MSAEPMEDPTAGAFNGLKRFEHTLPSRWYHDAAQYERELGAVWYRQWVYLCRAATLPEPRSYRTFTLGTQPLLLVRDEAGEIRGYYNTCRHRGAALCQAPEGRVPAGGITCPYHGWNYRLNGELARIPSAGRAHFVEREQHGLYPVAVQVWRGFVYVNLAGADGPSFDANFNANTAQFANWPLEDLVPGHRLQKRVRCNWKVFWENYNECLHCAGIHPGLVDMVPIYRRGIMEERDDPDWETRGATDDPQFRGGMKRGAASWTAGGASLGNDFARLTDAERKAGYHFMTSLPSQYLVLHVDHVRSSRLLPIGPEELELEVEWLFPPATLADASIDIMKACDFSAGVMLEDAAICEVTQRGLHSMAHERGVLMPEEYDVWRFQQWVRQALGAG
jgi:Rieske 2Fe-2S family protein